VVTWSKDFVATVTANAGGCATCRCVDCPPWRVTVSTNPTHLCNSPRTPNYDYAMAGNPPKQVVIPVGTVLRVLGVDPSGPWYQIATDADPPQPQGYIMQSHAKYLDGTPTEIAITAADGRDGTPATAIAHAQGLIGGGSGYNDLCLGFVKTCYGINLVPDRCPPMNAASAILAYHELSNKGLIVNPYQVGLHGPYSSEPGQLPAGAIVFFDVAIYRKGKKIPAANSPNGHVALVADDQGNVISSGAPSGPHTVVWKGSLADVGDWTQVSKDHPTHVSVSPIGYPENYLGYTMPDIAFTPGTWAGALCCPPAPAASTSAAS
jgi:hypothetical protein